MSKRILISLSLVIVFISLFTLSGCGNPSEAGANNSTELVQETEATEIQTLSPTAVTTETISKPTPTSAPTMAPSSTPTSAPTMAPSPTSTVTPTMAPTPTPTPAPTLVPTSVPSPEPTKSPLEQMSPRQRNSINMLNYLTVLVQEVNSSTNSRLFLESAYSKLINNTEPSIVDDLTLDEYEKILGVIEKYRMLSVKRERLQYIYEQNSAAALRSAMPNPLALLNVVQSKNPLEAIVSVAYLALDSVTSYNSYTSGLDLQYLQDGWALDDEEAANLHDSRTSMFSYMVRISRDLPRGLTLSEDAVTEFVKWTNETNNTSKIRWLESNRNTYKYYGEYWIVLAESYYEAGKYAKCLSAIDEYEALDNSIFRRDIRFAQALPCAIVAARETLKPKEYETVAYKYAQLILYNTYNNDWSLRYFAAQTLIDLYAKTNNKNYLSQAFEIVYDNVNELAKNQAPLNKKYLADVELKSTKNVPKEDKKEIESYNELLKKTRETELPPIYEPLRLNCDLLFAMADKLNISSSKKAEIDSILHPNGEQLFLNACIDSAYRFSASLDTNYEENIQVEYDADTVRLPASILSDTGTVVVTISDGNSSFTVNDWAIQKVDRNKSKNVNDFVAVLKSPSLKKYTYKDGSKIMVEVYPTGKDDNNTVKPIFFKFEAKESTYAFVIKRIEFTRVYE